MAEEDESLVSVATWRVLTLFLFIIAIDLICEFGNEAITHHFRHKQQSGLLHAWEQLKFETMALGLVSLLLIIGEEQLLKICIDSSSSSDPTDSPGNDAKRRLLAKAVEHSCPDGQEPVWESKLIHKAHLLIFLIAAVHILYSVTSIGLSLLAMKRWKRFEKQVTQAVQPLPEPWAVVHGHSRSGIFLGLAQLFRQFYRPLDIGTYAALRRLFLDKMNVAPDFNFAAFVSDYLAEEFSSVVKFDVFMWLLAIVWVAFPKGWYAGFVVTGLFIALSVASGAKLHAVAINMALQAPLDPAGAVAAADAVAVAVVDSAPATGLQAAETPARLSARAQQRRVSVPHAIAEGFEDVSATSQPLEPEDTPAPTLPLPPSEHTAAAAHGDEPGGEDAVCKRHRQDPQALFWFGKPRLMLRIFRYAYFENALALAVLVFGFWKEDGSVFGREAQYGRGAAAVGWLFVDCLLLLLLHSSMFLLPLYALTAAAAEFSNPAHVLDFARERGIRADLVAFLEATEDEAKSEDDKAAAEQQAGADHQPTFSLPAYSPRPHAPSPPPHPSLQQPPPGPAALRGASPQTTPRTVPRPKSQPHQGPRADASPATPLRRLSGSRRGAPASAASRLSKVSCPPTVTASALPSASSAAAAAGGSVGGQYARGAAAPVPLPAAVRSNMLHRVSAAGLLHRQSVPVGPSAAFPALQRPSVPCSPYSHAGLLGDAAAAGAGAQPGTSGRDKARPGGLPEERPSPQELQRRSGLSRMSMKGRLTMMADVMLGTDYLERSAQVSAPHGGNIARASDDAAAVAAHTAVPAPLAITASRHANSVQGLLEAMALQRMVELSHRAVAEMQSTSPP